MGRCIWLRASCAPEIDCDRACAGTIAFCAILTLHFVGFYLYISEFVIEFPPVQMARLVFDFNGKDKNMGCTCKDPGRVYDHGPQPELFYGE